MVIDAGAAAVAAAVERTAATVAAVVPPGINHPPLRPNWIVCDDV